MDTDKYTPNTFRAVQYETGDRFAFEIRPDDHYEIIGRTVDGTGVIQFGVRRSNEGGAEQMEYTMTFPADMPISARRRIRRFEMKCMLCPNTVTTDVDTAYSALNAVVCGKH